MKKVTREIFKDKIEAIKKLPENEKASAITKLNIWTDAYEAAIELEYPKYIVDKIKNARNETHAVNILSDARRKCS